MLEGPPQNFGWVSLVERFEETHDLRLIVDQCGFLQLQPTERQQRQFTTSRANCNR